ncbi:PLC-like phosphodiesterase [Umbelopsis sp. PMI_123]|nr:PLC-like phosphodiesterase [Umbelopsis sp. PMI_123]
MKLLALSSLLAATASLVYAQTACNGDSSLCSKAYNSVTYLTTHNSYAFQNNAAANQHYPITTQLSDGVRGLKLSAVQGNQTGVIELCHTSCTLLDDGTASNTLAIIATWLEANPNEVVTIMWNNLGNFNISAFESAYSNGGNIMNYVYTQPVGSFSWPTLQSMISSGKRLVNFIDTGADQTTVPWLMAEFNYVFETPYDNQNLTAFTCTIGRPTNPASPDSMMYVMNHFLYGVVNIGSTVIEVPQPDTANVTNGQSLQTQATQCTSTFGRQPNFIEVDFYEQGECFQVVDSLNNVAYVSKALGTATATATGTTINNSASSSSSFTYVTLLCLVLGSLFVTL